MSHTELHRKQATAQAFDQAHTNPRQRSCDSLGACQCRLPACSGCTWVATNASRIAAHAFAPGVITSFPTTRRQRLRLLARKAFTWGRAALLAALVLVSLAMASGYLVGSYMGGV